MPTLDPLRSTESLSTNKTQAGGSKSKITTTTESVKVPFKAARSDAFSLSEQGKAVSKLSQKLAEEPSFDATKVANIKEEIANGTYNINENQLAKNMLAFEQGLKK